MAIIKTMSCVYMYIHVYTCTHKETYIVIHMQLLCHFQSICRDQMLKFSETCFPCLL